MRVVEVHPEEVRPIADVRDPFKRVIHDRIAATLAAPLAGLRVRRDTGVCLESLREAAIRIENDRTDESSRPETAASERLGERGEALGQRRVGVVPDAVARWHQAGEEAGVRRQRERRDRGRRVEHHALACEPLERGQRHVHEAVWRQPVGARRVERDHDDAGRRRGGGTPACAGSHDARDKHRDQSRPGSACHRRSTSVSRGWEQPPRKRWASNEPHRRNMSAVPDKRSGVPVSLARPLVSRKVPSASRSATSGSGG